MKIPFWFVLFLVLTAPVLAQKHTLSGYVREEGSKELLIGVNIFVPELNTGSITNEYGFYSITLPAGTYNFAISYVGYQKKTEEIILDKDVVRNFILTPGKEIEEVIVAGDRSQNSRDVQMSTITIPVREIKNIPVFLGEKDVLKVLQLMPGVQKGSEGQTGIYVRGGGPDQNLMILDDAPVYNAQHLFGFFSVFNGDALRSVELMKGGFPARYGGRLSSVIDMNMKDGNRNRYTGEFGIGAVGARGLIEGPIIKDKSSFIVSARRTYIDILLMPIILSESNGDGMAGYYFYDFNAKANYDIDDKNKLFLSGYFGRDKFYARSAGEGFKAGIGWGNATGTLRWNHQYSPKAFANSSFIVSRFRFEITGEESEVELIKFRYYSGIMDYGLKHDFHYFHSTQHTIRAGIQSTYHIFTPKARSFKTSLDEEIDQEILDFLNRKEEYKSFESGIYIEDLYKPDARWQLQPGIRFSAYHMENDAYYSIEPRFSASFMLTENLSVKSSYARMKQYIHLLSNTGIGLPTDLWVPATKLVKPQESQQIAGGFAKDLFNGVYNISLEGYYKWIENAIQYKPGANFFIELDEDGSGNEVDWQNLVTSGTAKSYGMEVFAQKTQGKFTGWIGYTLSWTKLHFNEINFGNEFWARYDRRNDVSLVGIYEINSDIKLSAVWVYGTGNAVTLTTGTFYPNPDNHFLNSNNFWNEFSNDYNAINDFRMEAYHRLDLGIQFVKEKARGTRTIEINVYNAYNRKNPYFYDWEERKGKNVLIKYSLFPIIPSISYNFKFK